MADYRDVADETPPKVEGDLSGGAEVESGGDLARDDGVDLNGFSKAADMVPPPPDFTPGAAIPDSAIYTDAPSDYDKPLQERFPEWEITMPPGENLNETMEGIAGPIADALTDGKRRDEEMEAADAAVQAENDAAAGGGHPDSEKDRQEE